MKKRNIWLSALIAAILMVTPAAFAACDNATNSDITFTLAQEGGEADKTATTAVKITFSAAVDALTTSEVVISGAASASAAPAKSGTDGKVWTVPVVVPTGGNATVKLVKAGVSASAKSVAVFAVPASGNGEFANNPGGETGYTGTPFTNPSYRGEASNPAMPEPYADQTAGQKIPGKVMLAYYDVGGQDISFHSLYDPANESGTHKNVFKAFRDDGATPIGVKQVNNDDKNGPHMVAPTMGMMYFGYTMTGEWVKLTVVIEETGLYDVELNYSSNNSGAKISLAFDGGEKEVIEPASTQSYHRWNHAKIAQYKLTAGTSVLTLTVEDKAGFNLCYLDFKKVD